jgi:uncharacterized protein (TIGR00106 family)
MPAEGKSATVPSRGGDDCIRTQTNPDQGLVFIFGKKGDREMANANVSIQVLPRIKGDADVYAVVDEAIKVIAESGLKYEVGPMETTVEGDYDEIMPVVKAAQEAVVAAGSERVMTIVKIDYCPAGVTMEEKVGKYRA